MTALVAILIALAVVGASVVIHEVVEEFRFRSRIRDSRSKCANQSGS